MSTTQEQRGADAATNKCVKVALVLAVLALGGVIGFVYAGWYPVGADVPHTKPVYWVLETLRERSIASAARDIGVPPLDNPDMLLQGGQDYNDMCTGCHLKPGKTRSDMSIGLYPSPPNLAKPSATHEHGDSTEAARRQFWIIKHGIKASGMPAWGHGHDDQRIWAMVAFLQKLPSLTPEQYQILTARDEAGAEDEKSSHGH
ncbi:MAG: cytochrome c [Gammaproteobacteria bacterium]|nr:cytochrome c [Gammaproteobacteria bacterium]